MENDELLSRIDIHRGESLEARSTEPELAELEALLKRDPEAQAALDGVQRLDARIADALGDVPIPVGLADRILASLSAATPSAVAPAEAAPAESMLVEAMQAKAPAGAAALRSPTLLRRRPLLRRSVLAAAASGALAAAIFGAVIWSRPTAAPYTEDSIAAAAREAFANDQPGSLLEQKAPPPGFPVSSIVGTPAGARWRKLPSFLGRSAVVYQLRRGPTRGDLFVVRLAASPRAPKIELSRVPVSPQPVSTAGMTSAVWREQGLLFALVVEGGDGEYRRFIAAHPVVAMLAPARQR